MAILWVLLALLLVVWVARTVVELQQLKKRRDHLEMKKNRR